MISIAVLIFTIFYFTESANSAELRQKHKFASPRTVINLPVSRFPQPYCTYTVRKGSRDGPAVTSHISVGEVLYHGWNCTYSKHDSAARGQMYCLMVHNCIVSTVVRDENTVAGPLNEENLFFLLNRPREIEMIDEFGCSLYPQILPHIQYDGDLAAGVEGQAFSLDFDKPAIFFKCNIRLLLKANGLCRRPICAT